MESVHQHYQQQKQRKEWSKSSGGRKAIIPVIMKSCGLLITISLFVLITNPSTLSDLDWDVGSANRKRSSNPRFKRSILTDATDPTLSPPSSEEDVFIAVKTTKSYHPTRLADILNSWYALAPENIWFFTDGPDEEIERITGRDHLVQTNCPSGHNRQALCCKMGVEFDRFMESNQRWFCHFDDDNYVNVPKLYKMLSGCAADPRKEELYLGKPSTRDPISISTVNDNQRQQSKPHMNNGQKISFWFATGGAGFCLSRALAERMAPFAGRGQLMKIGDQIRLPDDVTLGYIAEHLLNVKLTTVAEFHSHLESMRLLPLQALHHQISLSGGSYNPAEENVVPVPQLFSKSEDQRRFKSLHCFLYPQSETCP